MLNRLKLMTLPAGEGGPKGRMRAGSSRELLKLHSIAAHPKKLFLQIPHK